MKEPTKQNKIKFSNRVIDRIQCGSCAAKGNDTKKNNQIVYDDGHTYCQACSLTKFPNEETLKALQDSKERNTLKAETIEELFLTDEEFSGDIQAIPERGLSKETCEKLEIYRGEYKGRAAHGYQYNAGFKIRVLPKEAFIWKDHDMEKLALFGIDKVDKTKPLALCEGEIDSASFVEVGFQAVSILSGSSVKKDLEKAVEELKQFPEIWLAFDDDEVGNKALDIAKELLSDSVPLYLIRFKGLKDANEALLAGTLKDCIEARKELRPEGIIFGSELDYEELWKPPTKGLALPWSGVTESLGGLDYGQLYVLLAGSSVGKSSILRELVYFYRTTQPQLKIANIFLEEDEKISKLAYLALHTNIPLGQLKRNRDLIPEDQREALTKEILETPNLMFINDQYNRNSDYLVKTIKYLVKVKKYDIIVLDHISYIIGRSAISKHGERRDIDELLYTLQDLTRELKCILIAACHLNDPPGEKSWSDGVVPKMESGRGSRVLAQVPDGVIGLSRNLTNPREKDTLNIHVLKNRWDGKLGHTDTLFFNSLTGRLVEP